MLKLGLEPRRHGQNPLQSRRKKCSGAKKCHRFIKAPQHLYMLAYKFMFGLNFLCMVARNIDICWKQLQLLTDGNGNYFLWYTEDVSKNNQGGLKHRKVNVKVVDACENTKDRQQCIITFYKKYEYHCPENKRCILGLKLPLKPKCGLQNNP